MNHTTTDHHEILDLLIETHDHLTLQGITPLSGYVFLQMIHAAVNVAFFHSTVDDAANTFFEEITDFYPQSLSM